MSGHKSGIEMSFDTSYIGKWIELFFFFFLSFFKKGLKSTIKYGTTPCITFAKLARQLPSLFFILVLKCNLLKWHHTTKYIFIKRKKYLHLVSVVIDFLGKTSHIVLKCAPVNSLSLWLSSPRCVCFHLNLWTHKRKGRGSQFRIIEQSL